MIQKFSYFQLEKRNVLKPIGDMMDPQLNPKRGQARQNFNIIRK